MSRSIMRERTVLPWAAMLLMTAIHIHSISAFHFFAAASSFISTGQSRQRCSHIVLSASPNKRSPYDKDMSSKPLSNSQKRRLRRLQEGRTTQRKQVEASAAMDLPPQPVLQTLEGGPDMIFKMARSLLLWQSSPDLDNGVSPLTTTGAPPNQQDQSPLPRWHPTNGISDQNPGFRTQSPVMNSQGYASLIWRNVRKRDKPSLWRYALRTYDRMQHVKTDGTSMLASNQTTTTTSIPNNSKNKPSKIQPKNIHHEGALLACAKLGLWHRALGIFESVQRQELQVKAKWAVLYSHSQLSKRIPAVHVTDSMILSLVRAAVKSVRQGQGETAHDYSVDRRRAPLDQATQILLSLQDTHPHLPLAARHLNPLAAAYQSLGLLSEAADLLDRLEERVSGPEADVGQREIVNVYDVLAKDKASYSMLVRGAVSTNDWVAAVTALKNMTEAGLYPTSRHLNGWTEISERKTKQRTTRSWKKKRDELWIDSVQ